MKWPWLLVTTGYFYGIHSINGVFLVLITGITWARTVSLSILITNSPAVSSSEESGLSERLDGSPGERWTLDAARRLGHVAELWLMISSGIRPPNTWGLDYQRKKMVGNVRVWEVLYYNIQVIRIPKMWEILFTNQYKRDDIGFLTIQWSGVVATKTTNGRYFHFRHLMEILVLIWTYHRTYLNLFLLIFTYFNLYICFDIF